MISIILVLLFFFFIGKTYYSLAEEHNKERPWVWAILGIVAYYGGSVILALFYLIYIAITADYVDFDNMSKGTEVLLGLVGGLMGTIGLYQFLRYRWNKVETRTETDDILDEDFLNDDFSDNNFSTKDIAGDDYLGDDK